MSVAPSQTQDKHYIYCDADGSPLYRVIRTPNKQFRQERFADAEDSPLGKLKPRWVGGRGCMDGVPLVLFRLPELLASGNQPVFIPEGEKDADNLTALGLTATCNPGGARKWSMVDSSPLAGRLVVVLPDADEPGRDHARDVCRDLQGKAADVRVLQIPDLPAKGDVSDFIERRRGEGVDDDGIRVELLQMAASAPAWHDGEQPGGKKKPKRKRKPEARGGDADDDDFRPTELRFAKRLIDRHHAELRFCNSWGWLHYTGTHWRRDELGAAQRLTKAIVRDAAEEDPKAEKFESAGRIAGILKLAESDERIRVLAGVFDADPCKLNCATGTLDLLTGELHPHNPSDHITKIGGAAYDPAATCPRFERFVLEIFGGDVELAAFLRRSVGYSLSGDTREQVLFLLHGHGANGKSVLLKTLQRLLGNYAIQSDPATFMAKRDAGVRNDVARLAGSRLVAAIETEEGERLAESLVKSLTGGDTVTARFLFREHFEFDPQFKLWLAANHKPEIRGVDFAIWRRILLIPFEQTFAGSEADPELGNKLAGELPGILGWAVRGFREWQAGGLQAPDVVRAATREYRSESDVLGDWLGERCIQRWGAESLVGELYKDFAQWSAEGGVKPLSVKKFRARLDDRGFGSRRTGRARYVLGLELRGPTPDPEDGVPAMYHSDSPGADGDGYDGSAPIRDTPLLRSIAGAGACVEQVSENGADPSHPSPIHTATDLPDPPSGWSRTSWARELRRKAAACHTTNPRRAAELDAEAERFDPQAVHR